ncbi:MAG TPA: phospholipase D family protein [Syntrophomonadaceae bacterium]|nr:phospholipase D family protein [Syntrophomonadaceae bacterium]
MMENIIQALLEINKFKLLQIIILVWFIYIFLTAVLIFAHTKPISPDYMSNSLVANFYAEEVGPDRGILIDNPLDSGLARLKIINDAQETLNISYFSIETGESPNLFFGALLEAADRGVKVNLLLDGIFHGIKGEFKPIMYTFMLHPNMNLKLYEPLNLLKPWTLNNRMHDKYIIADNQVAIIGGRNIGDKYFAPEWYNYKVTNDRDVIVINTDLEDLTSVVYQMSNYFEKIWHHQYAKPVNKIVYKIRHRMASRKSAELKEKFALAKEINQDILQKPIDLIDVSFPTNKITFIHNPLDRFAKEPWCWYEITQLMKYADDSIFIQSPYVIPSKGMIKGFLNKDDFIDKEIFLLTNSLGSTPNLPAYSGYLNHRKSIVDKDINVFEFQSEDSLHTKAFVFDSELVAIGSFNLDHRSAYLSTESMVVIHSAEGVKKLEEGLASYVKESLLVDRDYNYVTDKNVAEIPVHPIKRIIINSLSYIVKWFEYLL